MKPDEQRRGRSRLALATAGGAVLSLGITAASATFGRLDRDTAALTLVEVALLVAGVVVTVRRCAPTETLCAAGLAACAVAAWPLRYGSPASAGTLLGCLSWAVIALAAAGAGFYLRSIDRRRVESVARARREQRLAVARDLHDFVAHDVSGILALAQAGQVVERTDPGRSGATFAAIETAAVQALEAMDRTVEMLRGDDTADTGRTVRPLPSLTELPELVSRFEAASTATVSLQVDDDAVEAAGRASATTAYRVVSEALTNVRRHAPDAVKVAVTVRCDAPGDAGQLCVEVVNDGVKVVPAERRRGGHGLRALAERAEALGGQFTAGATPDARWRVLATLPLRAAP